MTSNEEMGSVQYGLRMEIADRIYRINNVDTLMEVFDLCKAQMDVLKRQAKRAFKAGDKVWFESRDGRPVHGVIVKVMKVNVQMRETSADEYNDGKMWRVDPTLLEHEVVA